MRADYHPTPSLNTWSTKSVYQTLQNLNHVVQNGSDDGTQRDSIVLPLQIIIESVPRKLNDKTRTSQFSSQSSQLLSSPC